MLGFRAVLTRRELLALGAAGSAALVARARRAGAIGEKAKLRLGELQLGPGTGAAMTAARPNALRRLAWEVEKRTSIDVELEPRAVGLGDAALHETPFLYLAGDREFAVPSEDHVERLRRFLTFGGFLVIDSAEGRTDGAFDKSVRRLIEAVFPPPAEGLQIVPRDHVVHKSFYLIEQPVGRLAIAPALEGVLRDDRLMVAYVGNDLGGAWERDNLGNWAYPCDPGGERQRELSFRLGINLVMYAMCLDYKTDQVHVEFIMRRRRWRSDDGDVMLEPDVPSRKPPRKPRRRRRK